MPLNLIPAWILVSQLSMSIQAGTGVSQHRDSFQAGVEAAYQAMGKIGGRSPALVIVFSSVAFDQKRMLEGVRSVTKNAPLWGCSDAGEITAEGPHDKSVAVMCIAADEITFTPGVGRDIKKDAREAGRAVARDVKTKTPQPLKAFMMLPDVLTGNGAEIVRGVLDILGEHFPVVGGAPGDDFLFKETYQYINDEVTSGAVAGCGLSGNFSMGIGVRHGWLPIGLPMKVTKSEGAVLHELDGKPAISIYEDYFGAKSEALRKEPLARMAITYPLGLKVEGLDEYLIRDPITVDEKGSITCAAEIPEGSEIRLMIGSREKAVEAAREAAKHAIDDLGEHPARLSLVFNCIAREKLYGRKAIEEIQAMRDVLGKDVPMLGFYTYGEQAPLAGEVRNIEKCNPKFYNETVVIFVLGE